MLSKLSVKKPYTVLVGVVIILVLGFMSFRNMHTDLLPDMDLPYAIVMTTYAGASPEEVETAVTKPVEQSMASISNVKKISSISNSNVSVVVMQFNDGANMNTATIDMRESLDVVSANWEDGIGSPTIMKINPDMMPILVAGIDCEGMDSYQLSKKLEKDILPELERIEGVASITESGNKSKQINVILQQDKIDAVNKRIKNAINGKFAKAEKKIERNEDKLAKGKDAMGKSSEMTAEKLAEGSSTIDQNSQKISETLLTMQNQLTQLEEKEASLKQSEQQVDAGLVQVATSKAQLNATIANLTNTIASLQQMKDGLETLRSQESSLKTAVEAGAGTEVRTQLQAVETQIQGILTQLSVQGMTEEQLATALTEAQTGLTQAKASLAEVETQEASLKKSKKELLAGKKQLQLGKKKIQNAKKQLEKGKMSLVDAKKELSKQSVLAAVQLSVATVEINQGASALTEGKNSLKDAKKNTKTSTDLNQLLTKSMLEGILTAENFEMPAGYITEDGATYLVKVGKKLEDQEDLENLVLLDFQLEGLKPIRLSDVADIALADPDDDSYTVINGNDAIALTMEKATGYSTGDVTKRVVKRMEQLEKEIKGLHITVLMNQGIYIDMVVKSVIQNLLLGGLFAVFILLLFLKDLRPTIIVACSIPLSVVAAVVLMYFSGVTLNVISLSGLALGVGMLVDNSVVVIENIFRMRNEEGASIRQASIEGAKQVTGAIIASTLTTVCVFVPIVFTEGITRQLFQDLALTLGYSLLASLVVGLTLVPAMAQGLLKRDLVQKEGFIYRLQRVYVYSLEKLLRHKILVLLTAFGLLIVFIGLAFSRGTTFMPAMGSTQMTATISKPKDKKMSDAAFHKICDEATTRLMKVKGVETIGAMGGNTSTMSMMSSSTGSQVSLYILLEEKMTRSNAAIKKDMLQAVEGLSCEMEVSESAMDMSSMMGSGITLQVKGKNLDQLQKVTVELMKRVEDVKGIESITNGMEDSEEEIRIQVNKDDAMACNLTVAQIFQQVNAKVADAKKSTTLSTDTQDWDVYVSHEQDDSMTKRELKNMKITYTDSQTQKSKKVKLSKLAKFVVKESPKSINREDQSRYMTVSITIADGYNVGLVSKEVNKKIKGYTLPAGYTLASTGEDESTNEAMGQVGLMIFVGVLFMYLIMVAQFQSLLSPFIILFTIPLAFTGGFMALFISGSEVSVIAMIGFVMLSGIIVNNGIVLVDYINQLRISGVEKTEAILTAGRIRLRPILMTATTTILGLLPMLVTKESGSDMVKPMSIVTVGGMVYGTLLTLFVVPCIYAILNRKTDRQLVESQADE